MLFSPFERRAFGQNSLQGFDGWLVKPVRARSLFDRLASEFAPAASAPAPTRSLAPDARAMRALLAEDNDINAVVAQKALRRLGFEVVRARDGEEATRLAGAATRGQSPRFDVILMDIKMPGIDGYEAARAHSPRSSARPARRASALDRVDRQCDGRGSARQRRGGLRRISRQAGRSRPARRNDRAPARRARAARFAGARAHVINLCD